MRPPKHHRNDDDDDCCGNDDDDNESIDFPSKYRNPTQNPVKRPKKSNEPKPIVFTPSKPRPPICEEDLKMLGKLCTTLKDFVDIGNVFNKYIKDGYDYIDMKISSYRFTAINKIAKMNNELTEINDMIGLGKIKQQLVSQIAYLLSNYKQHILMHTVITGNPGTGKTRVSKLIGNAYYKSGILTNSVFVQATRAELIGKFLGQTAPNTKALFTKAKGGVIFIDEIYSLGNGGGGTEDSYSKECIDTINQMLSEHPETMCIVAGYAKEVDSCFFSMNKGLESRFPWRFEIDPYTGNELHEIFKLNVKQGGWTLENDKIISSDFFNSNKDFFQSAGRDVENFYVKCCIAHATRLFLDSNDRTLNKDDINRAMKTFKEIKDLTKKQTSEPPFGMYI